MFSFLRRSDGDLTLACSANEHYAPGLAATIRSALEHLDPRRRATLYVLDAGLSEATRRKLLRSWSDQRVRARFLAPDVAAIRHLKLTQGMQSVVYFRLLLPRLLPRLSRVLYLDSDLLVRDDLAQVWDAPLDGKPIAAVRDVLLSTTLSAIPHHDELRLNPDAPYFSSALMLMDLDRWRGESIGERTIEFIAAHPEAIRWWDQDGLNAVLNGEWTQLDPTWNVYAEAARLLGWEPKDHERAFADDLVARQRVVHFATRYKPWKHNCPHPKTPQFLETLSRTAWRDWRPEASSEIPYPPQPL